MSKSPKAMTRVYPEMPQAIKVLGATYEVHLHKDLPNKESIHGDCDIEKRIIRISIDTPPAMLSTLFHESLHAAFAESGLNALIPTKTEEAIILMLERYLADIVQLDKHFVYLPEGVKNDRSTTPQRPRSAAKSRKRLSTRSQNKCSR